MKRSSDRWLTSMFTLAACLLVVLCLPTVATVSSPPADGVHFCLSVRGTQAGAVVDDEAWLREDLPHAGKAAAEKNAGEPRTVRMIYFLPNDRPYRQEVVDSMKTMMRLTHTFFGEQMAAHGYGGMNFRYETDSEGEPLVHRVDGDHGDAYYLKATSNRSLNEIFREYERRYHVYLVVVDNSKDHIYDISGGGWSGMGNGNKNNGYAFVSAGFGFNTVAHELGHAFGIDWHDYRDKNHVMSSGGRSRWRLSACSAGYLSVASWFNPEISQETDWSSRPTIEFIAPTRWYPAGSTHVTIPMRVSDPDGVHQVILMVRSPRQWRVGAIPNVKACRMLAGETETIVAFEYDGVIPGQRNSSLSDSPAHFLWGISTDTHGNTGTVSSVIAQQSPYHLASLKDQSCDAFTSVAFSPDGGLLAAGSTEGTVRLWDVASRQHLATLEAPNTYGVASVAFSPDGSTLASGLWQGNVTLWDVASREEVATLEWHGNYVRSVAYSPDGDLLASVSDSTVILWDVASREEIATLKGHTTSQGVRSLAFSPDGTTLASGSGDRTIKLWDVASREEIATLEGHGNHVNSVAFSPDGGLLASGSTEGTVRLWDVASRQHIATLDAGDRRVGDVAFSPDGGALAADSGLGRVDLWDVTSEKLVDTFAQPSWVKSIAFSPDGGVLAAASDFWIYLWDTASFTSTQSRVPDFDGDGEVGFGDFVKFAAKFGFSRGEVGYDPRFDLDRDGTIGFADFLVFAWAFGKAA